MLRLSIFFITVILFSSCNKPTGIKAIVTGADSAAINFFKGDGSRDSVIKVVILRDKKQLQRLADFIESGSAKNKSCGADGSLHFFKSNQVVQDISFRMNDDGCRHFTFMLGGNSFQTNLSAGARDFLQALLKL